MLLPSSLLCDYVSVLCYNRSAVPATELNSKHLKAEGPRIDSASALLSLQKGCGLWTLFCDFVPYN